MNILETARKIRAQIEQMAQYAPDEVALEAVSFFPSWLPNNIPYAIDDRVRRNGILYRCLTTHTSQADWTPDTAHSLWVRIDDPAVEWPEWRQPEGAHDAYPKGAKASHEGEHWISDTDANAWEPGVYGWSKVA